MIDLRLEGQFTDRAGRTVYNIVDLAGRVLGQIRLKQGEDVPECMLEWTVEEGD